MKSIKLNTAERDLLQDALLNYIARLELLISMPEDIERREFFKAKLDRVNSLRAKIN